ncbi:class I SAM-dependent methyltransferase [Albidovulum sediminis]|uniref:Class I SAM-dependent methyltransferase n=1 Tax=Albidovulum sediminis TaxID=3066345 RepID=A0ABT2NL85_9RHOB|nr:class I SAM-dependent methyltransferase [Defluviimonas sediminis]MCT8328280.1 class I SAM-dependent methyltransferase [Defluviimonas sediminis]
MALDPPAFFRWLASLPPRRDVCVECGAGAGEVTAFLGGTFARAIATDAAPPHSGVPCAVPILAARAEHLPFADASADLVVSMQALHHFDVPAHLREARRILRPGGVFAALCWGEIVLPEALRPLYRPAFAALAPFWESERDWVLSGYRGLGFAGQPVPLPTAAMRRRADIAGLNAEISRWSAARAARRAGVAIPLPKAPGLAAPFDLSWPLIGRVFRA